MADAAHEWAIVQAVKARLQTIHVASGYRTDAGSDVRDEPGEYIDLASPRVTIFSGGTKRGAQANQREFVLILESAVPVTLADAHAAIVAMAADNEDALTNERLPLPNALPLKFEETLYLDRPEGVAAMVAQQMFTAEYRR